MRTGSIMPSRTRPRPEDPRSSDWRCSAVCITRSGTT
jgi:hypothetical protein